MKNVDVNEINSELPNVEIHGFYWTIICVTKQRFILLSTQVGAGWAMTHILKEISSDIGSN